MNKIHEIKFLVTKEQKEKITNDSKAHGYVTIASYLRSLALGNDIAFAARVDQLIQNHLDVRTYEKKKN